MFFRIKLYLHLNCVRILNWIVWNRIICIKMDLAVNNLQRLICHKTKQPNQQPSTDFCFDPFAFYWFCIFPLVLLYFFVFSSHMALIYFLPRGSDVFFNYSIYFIFAHLVTISLPFFSMDDFFWMRSTILSIISIDSFLLKPYFFQFDIHIQSFVEICKNCRTICTTKCLLVFILEM